MAEHGVAALSHVPSGERVRTGPADPSGAWDQDLPPSTATTTQESGLRENRTSRLSERTEEGRKPDLLRLYRPARRPKARTVPARGWAVVAHRTAEVCTIVGGLISPLLSNLVLDELDRELER